MRFDGFAALVSVLLHAAIFAIGSRVEVERPKISERIAIQVVHPPPPVPEEPKPEPLPQEQPPVARAPVRKNRDQPIEKPAPSPEPEKPAPPPSGFSVDLSSTVEGGKVAVPAVDGGGNPFADPNDRSLKPGEKASAPTPPASGDGTGPGRGDAEVVLPKFLTLENERTPPYPELARKNGIEGEVLLRILVDEEGRVAKVLVVHSVGHGLDEAAATHAKTAWKFSPAIREGHAVSMWIMAPVKFLLDSE